jgi:hypothetical protein
MYYVRGSIVNARRREKQDILLSDHLVTIAVAGSKTFSNIFITYIYLFYLKSCILWCFMCRPPSWPALFLSPPVLRVGMYRARDRWSRSLLVGALQHKSSFQQFGVGVWGLAILVRNRCVQHVLDPFFHNHSYHAWQGCNDTACVWERDGGHFLSDLSGSHKMSDKKIQNHDSHEFLKTLILYFQEVSLTC